MNFELIQNQLNAQKIARNFSESTLSEDILTRDATAEFPRHLYDEMGRMGLIGIPYPVEMGGQGGDYLSYIVSLEEIAKVDCSMGSGYHVATSRLVCFHGHYLFRVNLSILRRDHEFQPARREEG